MGAHARTTLQAGLALTVFVVLACSVFSQTPSSPLHEAAWRGDVSAVQAMMKEGADVNVPDVSGFTPLYWAAQGGHRVGLHRGTPKAHAGWRW